MGKNYENFLGKIKSIIGSGLPLSKPSLGKGATRSTAYGTVMVPSRKVEFPSPLPGNDLSHPQHDMPRGHGIVMMAVPLSILTGSIELIS